MDIVDLKSKTIAELLKMAEDLDTARAAAKEIAAQCQACHTAAGVEIPE